MTNILEIYEVKQGFNSAKDYQGIINYPQPIINTTLKQLYKELQSDNINKSLITSLVIELDSQLTTSYFWYRFNGICETLNNEYNLGLTLKQNPYN